MDYKEKYEQALERAIEALNDGTISQNTIDYLCNIFPELADKDEKIRKAIIKYFTEGREYLSLIPYNKEQVLTWLEKQGEQKSIDKVEPKFKVGDWVVSPNCVYWHIDAIQNGRYEVTTDTGQCGNWPLDTNIYRLWTIQDAKDGDVLASELCSTIMLYKGIKDNNIQFYCDYDFSDIDVPGDRFAINNGQHYGSVDDSDDWHPATKEQRDLLFQKMKEAGYEWDAEKKELKKIEQKPAEWKQENVEELSEFENAMMHIGYSFFGKRGGLDPNDTSSVKEQAQYLLELAQKLAEWSEEDDDDAWMNDIISKAENNLQLNKAETDWLKSLKKRCAWKPSDEQITVLELASKYERVFTLKQIDILIGLKEQLKKLKGE